MASTIVLMVPAAVKENRTPCSKEIASCARGDARLLRGLLFAVPIAFVFWAVGIAFAV